jgi:hypothetical protein
MAVCDFTYKLTVPPAELLQEISKLVQEFKGELQGDEQSGTFQFDIMMGRLVGKPFLIGAGIINQTIKEYVRGLS